MLRARCCLVALVFSLDAFDARRRLASSMHSRCSISPASLGQVRRAAANTEQASPFSPLASSYCREREGTVGCAGGMRRGWCTSSFVFPRSSTWRRRRYRLSLRSYLLRHRLTSPPKARVACRSGWSGSRPRRCGAVVSMKKREEEGGGDGLALPSPRQLTDSELSGSVYGRPEVPKWRHKAVIIPGFATDATAFEQLCHRLKRRGVASVVVPIRWYHWLPTLGGRSIRPILDRIHETVIRCVGAKDHEDMPYAFNEPGLQSEVAPYTVQDFWAEMGDPKLGAHHMGPMDLPLLPAEPSVDERVVLIAHSAGGWMSRIYLSEASYDGRMYNASYAVSGLVTLGTPHVQLTDDQGRERKLPFSRNFKFVEDCCTGEEGGNWERRIPTVCIGGSALEGRSNFGGLYKDLVYQSYELCCGDGSGTGDGITPLKSAFDMAGAKRYVELEGVLHAAGLGGPWYGSDNVIDSWLEPSLDAIFGPPLGEEENSKSDDVVKRGPQSTPQTAVSCAFRDVDN